MGEPTDRSRGNASRPRRTVVFALLSAAVIAACTCAFVFVALRDFCHPGYRPLAFTPEGWAEANTERRGHMADDLLESSPLTGMTAAEVVALLGPPDDDQADIRRFRYHLGRRGRHPDCPFTDYSLLVRFDARGTVASADIAD